MKKKSATPKEDYSKSNPGLHLFYIGQALEHLLLIDECLTKLWTKSNLNLLDITQAMVEERNKLVNTNAAYAQAEEWIVENRTSLRQPLREWAQGRVDDAKKALRAAEGSCVLS